MSMAPSSPPARASIDPMVVGDLPAVAAIASSLHVDEGQLRDELARPWSVMQVARETESGVVAFMVAWRVADELHVLQVATREDRRRCGIARTLMERVLADGRRMGMRYAFLEVRCSNLPALAFYRSLGFEVGRVRRGYYTDGEDAVEMMLDVR